MVTIFRFWIQLRKKIAKNTKSTTEPIILLKCIIWSWNFPKSLFARRFLKGNWSGRVHFVTLDLVKNLGSFAHFGEFKIHPSLNLTQNKQKNTKSKLQSILYHFNSLKHLEFWQYYGLICPFCLFFVVFLLKLYSKSKKYQI